MLKKTKTWMITLMFGIGLIVIGFLIQGGALNTFSSSDIRGQPNYSVWVSLIW